MQTATTMRISLLSLAILLSLTASAGACPMCKESVANDEAKRDTVAGGPNVLDAGLPGGFNTSVYVMLAGFFGSLGLVGYTVVKGIRTAAVLPRSHQQRTMR